MSSTNLLLARTLLLLLVGGMGGVLGACNVGFEQQPLTASDAPADLDLADVDEELDSFADSGELVDTRLDTSAEDADAEAIDVTPIVPAVPVYVLRNADGSDLLTIDAQRRGVLLEAGWSDQGILGYAHAEGAVEDSYQCYESPPNTIRCVPFALQDSYSSDTDWTLLGAPLYGHSRPTPGTRPFVELIHSTSPLFRYLVADADAIGSASADGFGYLMTGLYLHQSSNDVEPTLVSIVADAGMRGRHRKLIVETDDPLLAGSPAGVYADCITPEANGPGVEGNLVPAGSNALAFPEPIPAPAAFSPSAHTTMSEYHNAKLRHLSELCRTTENGVESVGWHVRARSNVAYAAVTQQMSTLDAQGMAEGWLIGGWDEQASFSIAWQRRVDRIVYQQVLVTSAGLPSLWLESPVFSFADMGVGETPPGGPFTLWTHTLELTASPPQGQLYAPALLGCWDHQGCACNDPTCWTPQHVAVERRILVNMAPLPIADTCTDTSRTRCPPFHRRLDGTLISRESDVFPFDAYLDYCAASLDPYGVPNAVPCMPAASQASLEKVVIVPDAEWLMYGIPGVSAAVNTPLHQAVDIGGLGNRIVWQGTTPSNVVWDEVSVGGVESAQDQMLSYTSSDWDLLVEP